MVLLLGWCLDQTCLPQTTTQYLIYLHLYPPADTPRATSAPWPGNQGHRLTAILNWEGGWAQQEHSPAPPPQGLILAVGHAEAFLLLDLGPAWLLPATQSLSQQPEHVPGHHCATILGQWPVSCRVKGILKRHFSPFWHLCRSKNISSNKTLISSYEKEKWW